VRIDQQPELPPRSAPPRVLVEWGEIAREPPFRCAGVIEIRGDARDSVNAFLERVSELGARSGCEVVVQRDLFELQQKAELSDRDIVPGLMFPEQAKTGNGIAVWQFLCGVSTSSVEEARSSRRIATELAVAMRNQELGEVCAATTPIGSHVKTNRVCANR
jgi:hypothetical protein